MLVFFVSHGLELLLTHELIVSVLEDFVSFAPGLLDSFEGAFFLLFKKIDAVVHLLNLFFNLLPRVSHAGDAVRAPNREAAGYRAVITVAATARHYLLR